ncbi:MAG: sugar phosphate isomerase/epimerase [Planctomycetia bacterium]|nr:sugar phosphate isomerase/epimerase [Planctomycetia bacterium]
MERLGVRYVEFFGAHFPLDSSDEKIADMQATLKKAKLSIRAHGVNGFGKDHESNRKIFEFAKRAGFKTITADPAPDSFSSLDKLVAEYKIRIAIHNHGPGHRYDKLKDVASAVSGHHELIGSCVDTGHVLRSAEDPVKWIRELGKRCHALHIKDVAEMQDRTHDVIIGKGHLDVVGVFKALKEIKFPADGSLSMEYESNPDNPVEDVRQCLAIAAEAIGKANG